MKTLMCLALVLAVVATLVGCTTPLLGGKPTLNLSEVIKHVKADAPCVLDALKLAKTIKTNGGESLLGMPKGTATVDTVTAALAAKLGDEHGLDALVAKVDLCAALAENVKKDWADLKLIFAPKAKTSRLRDLWDWLAAAVGVDRKAAAS